MKIPYVITLRGLSLKSSMDNQPDWLTGYCQDQQNISDLYPQLHMFNQDNFPSYSVAKW